MPLCCGEKKTKEELEQEQYEKDLAKCYNRDQIYLDDKGNFRYGEKKFEPEVELRDIVDKDDPVEEEGKVWCVINTGWMNSWLLYAHLNRGVNPNPGRINNESLLDSNSDNTGWVPKEGLEMARKKHEGDYRRISEEAWKAFCELYPGSGPAIRTEFIPDEAHDKDGLYDCSGWQIDQSMYDELMDKKPVKKSLFSFGMKKKKDDEVRETEESVDKNAEVTDDGMEMTTGNNLKEFFGDSAVGDSDRPTEERESVQRRQSTSWLFED